MSFLDRLISVPQPRRLLAVFLAALLMGSVVGIAAPASAQTLASFTDLNIQVVGGDGRVTVSWDEPPALERVFIRWTATPGRWETRTGGLPQSDNCGGSRDNGFKIDKGTGSYVIRNTYTTLGPGNSHTNANPTPLVNGVEVTVQVGITKSSTDCTANRFAGADREGVWKLFRATPQAETLVGNVGQTSLGGDVVSQNSWHAQGFTTGANPGGYTLTSIEARNDQADAKPNELRAELWSSTSGGEPNEKLADLTVPGTVTGTSASPANIRFLAPPDTTLTANTTYHFVLYAGSRTVSSQANMFRIRNTSSDAEDSGAAAGMSIADGSYSASHATKPTSWSSSAVSRMIRVNGSAKGVTTVWSATLTPKDLGGSSTGCTNFVVGKKCSDASVLSDDDFELSSTTFAIDRLYYNSQFSNIVVYFDKNHTNEFRELTLHIGDNAYPLTGSNVLIGPADDFPKRIRVHNVSSAPWTVDVGIAVKLTQASAPLSSNADLSGLVVSAYNIDSLVSTPLTLAPAFDSATTSYTVSMPYEVSHVTFTPTVDDTGKATVHVGRADSTLSLLDSGSTSSPINVLEGSSPITVRVTAEDGTEQAYTVTVMRSFVTSVTAGAHTDGTPKLTVATRDPSTSTHDVVFEIKESSAAWPATRGTSDDLPSGVTRDAAASSAGSDVFRGFKKNTAYDVRAHLKTKGATPAAVPASTAALTATTWDVPGAPTAPVVTVGVNKLMVAWVAPTQTGATGAAITGYDLEYKETSAPNTAANPSDDPSTGWVDASHTGTATKGEITGLTGGTSYDVRVRAKNGINPGSAWSTTAQGTPQIGTFSVTATASAAEGAEVSLTVTLSENAPTGGVVFTITPQYSAGSNMAVAADVGSVPSTVTVAENTSSKTFAVPLVDDDLDENDETFKIVVATSNTLFVKAGDGKDTATVTITDNDTAGVTVTPTTLTVAEGASNTYTVVLDTQPTHSVALALTNPDVGAVTVSPTSHTFTTSTWNVAQTFTVTGVEENTDFDDESVTISHGLTSDDTQYGALTPDSLAVTVTDNDSRGTFSVTASASAAEGADASLTITLSDNAPAGGVSFSAIPHYLTSGSDNAVAGDVGAITTPVTVAENTNSKTITVRLVDDNIVENDETFEVVVATSNSLWVKAGDGKDTATVTISDGDTAGVTVSKTAIEVVEQRTSTDRDHDETYTVVLDRQPSHDVVVAATSDESAVVVRPASHTFTPQNWNVAKTFAVTAIIDVNKVSETATIAHTVTSDNAKYAAVTVPSVAVKAVDDDVPIVTWGLSSVTLTETDADVTHTGRQVQHLWIRGADPPGGFVIWVKSGSGTTAQRLFGSSCVSGSGSDFLHGDPRTFTVPDAFTSGSTISYSLTICGDDFYEETEVIELVIQERAGVYTTLGNPKLTITLRDDDEKPTTLGLSAAPATEDGGSVTVTATLDKPAPQGGLEVTLGVAAASTATASDDYAVPASITIDQGDTTATATLSITDDDLVEDAETVVLEATTTEPGITATGTTVTITDDDAAAAKIAFGNAADSTTAYEVSVAENVAGATLNVPVTVSHLPGAPTTFNVEVVSGNTATEDTGSGGDFSIATKSVAFGPTDASLTKNLAITIIDDSVADYVKTFGLRVTPADSTPDDLGDYYERHAAGATAAVTITDDDQPTHVTLTVENGSVSEDVGTVTVTAKLDRPAGTKGITITLTSGGSASRDTGSGGDYSLPDPFAITISGMDSSGTATVTITDDSVDEPDETISLAATTNRSGVAVTGTSFVIADDDAGTTPRNFRVFSHPTDRYRLLATWDRVPGASKYYVAFGSSNFPGIYNDANVNASLGTPDNPFVINRGVRPDRDTIAQVRAYVGNAYGGYSAARQGRPGQPSVLTLSVDDATPREGQDVTVTATLDWPVGSGSIAIRPFAAGGTTAVVGTDYTLPAAFSIGSGQRTATATLVIADDMVEDGDKTIVLDGAHSRSNFYVKGVTVTVRDDDTAGVAVSPTSLLVAKGFTASYTVVLTSRPTHDVVITPTSGDTTKATLLPQTLTFTPSDWDEPQTVTVTGVELGPSTISHAIASSDTSYPSDMLIDDVETAVLSPVTLSVASARVAENSSSVDVTATLAVAAPTGGVTVTLGAVSGTAVAPDDYTLPAPLTIDEGETSATATVTIVNDDLVEESETIVLTATAAASGMKSGVTGTGTTLTITDDEATVAKIAFGDDAAATSAHTLAVNEDTGTVYVPITLSARPGAETTFSVEVVPGGTATEDIGSGGDFSIASKTLTFGRFDTSNTKTIAVAITDDSDQETAESFTLRITAADNPANDLGDLYTRHSAAATVVVTIGANDNTAEFGAPTNVRAVPHATDRQLLLVTWDAVSGATDYDIRVGLAHESTWQHTRERVPGTSWDIYGYNSGSGYQRITTGLRYKVQVRAEKGDAHGPWSDSALATPGGASKVTLSVSDATPSEDAGTVTVTATLDHEVRHDNVVVTFIAGDGSTATATEDYTLPGSLTFSKGTSVPTRFGSTYRPGPTTLTTTLTIKEDQIAEGNETILLSATTNSADIVSVVGVSVEIQDNDSAGVSVSESALDVTEGATASYTVALTSKPGSDVTVTPASNNAGVSFTPASYTFTPTNWSSARTFTVSGDVAGPSTVTHIASSSDLKYQLSADDISSVAVKVISTDATLSALSASAGSLSPAFASATNTYTLAVPNGTTSVTLTATTSYSAATMTVGLAAGTKKALASGVASDAFTLGSQPVELVVTVTAEDGSTSREYAVTVNRFAAVPQNVAVQAGVQQLTVTWAAPANSGSAAVTGYRVRWRVAGSTPEQWRGASGFDDDGEAVSGALTYSISGLTSGVLYDVQVAAVTSAGIGAFSSSIQGTPEGTPEKLRFKRTKVKVSESRDGPNHVVRITRSGDISREVSVTLTFTAGTATAATDYRVDGRTLKIAANKRHRDVLLRIVNDGIVETKEETFTVALSTTTSGYVAGDPLTVTIVDDDVVGVELSETALTVKEKETVTYKLKLTSKPTHDVTITATSGDASKVRLHRDEMKTRTFTPDNWNKYQKLTVRAKPIGDATVTITHTATSDDTAYDGVAIAPITVTVSDIVELPSAVIDLDYTLTGNSVTVTWTAPAAPDMVSRYYVKVMPADSNTVADAKERLRRPQPSETLSETFRNLVAGATYRISVRAVGPDHPGKGERTFTMTFTVPASPPSQ